MLMRLIVNCHSSWIVSVAGLRRDLAPSASQQYREIWVSMEPARHPSPVISSMSSLRGGPSLSAHMNTNVGWLMYLRHHEDDTGFTSHNPMFDESDSMLGRLAFDGLCGREHLPVFTYRLSNGREEEFPASWALPESDIMRALEYFVQHEGRRAPFVQWHDDAVAESSSDISQPTEKGEFTVVLQTAGQARMAVISELLFLTGLGLREAREIIEFDAPKVIKEGVGRNEANKIKAILERLGATVEIKVFFSEHRRKPGEASSAKEA